MSIHINIPDYILFEDECILLVNKPCGLMVEPDRNGYPNLQNQVKQYLRKKLPAGEVVYAQHIHRLDRPVSGVILFAKQKAVLRNLSEQFATRTVKKFYEALTDKAPEQTEGIMAHWHRKEKKKAMLSDQEFPYAEKAVLHYEVSPYGNNRFLWRIELHTGKYHQIRAQLSRAGCPVIGDSLYGSDEMYQDHAIALHASRLVFVHPLSNVEMNIVAQNNFRS